MQTKRIIPCLDIRGGQVVKGVNFENIKNVGCPVEIAAHYSKSGADELCFYDIDAAIEGRGVFLDLLKSVAHEINIPLTVAGGVKTVADFDRLLECGADKISVNSGAIARREIIEEGAKKFGSQAVVLAIDAKRADGKFSVFNAGGRIDTGICLLEWIRYAQEHGAGELTINSIDTDGVKGGFDLEMLAAVREIATIPVVASGGAGKMDDFVTLFEKNLADAGLAASIFHFGEVEIPALKAYLSAKNIPVRM